MEKLSKQKEILNKEMNEAMSNHSILLEKSLEYEKVLQLLDEKEMRWLELSEKA